MFRIIKVEVGVISRNLTYRVGDLDYSGYHKNRILMIVLLYIEGKKMEVMFLLLR